MMPEEIERIEKNFVLDDIRLYVGAVVGRQSVTQEFIREFKNWKGN